MERRSSWACGALWQVLASGRCELPLHEVSPASTTGRSIRNEMTRATRPGRDHRGAHGLAPPRVQLVVAATHTYRARSGERQGGDDRAKGAGAPSARRGEFINSANFLQHPDGHMATLRDRGRCFAKAPKASAQLVSARPRSPPRHPHAISPCAKASVSTRATSSRATCCVARVDTAARRSPRQTSRFPSSLASIPTPRPRGSLGCHLHVARRCHRETYRSRPYTDHVARSRSNDRTTADRFRTAALAAGGKDRDAPGQRPYRPGHHATFVLDPDRSNIAGVHHNRSNRAVDAADAIKITFRPGRGAAMALSHHPCAPYGRSGDPPARRFHRS